MRDIRVLAAATAIITVATPLRAQSAAAWRDSAQRLFATAHQMSASLRQGDSTVVQTAHHGDLVVAASANERTDAIHALQEFVVARNRWFPGALPNPGGFRIRVDTWHRSSSGRGNEAGAVVLAGLPDSGTSARAIVMAPSDDSHLGNMLIDAYGQMMYASVPVLVDWLHEPPPLSMPDGERRDLAMYALVTAIGGAQRDCVSGDLSACALALDLRPAPGRDIGSAFNAFMRADLLLATLDRSGPGAWDRFRNAATGGMAAGLSAAANQPVDSVIAAWRQGLLDRRPNRKPLSAPAALLAVAWSALCLAAATGATRWG